jgi:hypothetical protein
MPPTLSSASREFYLLVQRAETFRLELELEANLRLQGAGTLPPEWTNLERERQMILDKIQWMEDFASSLSMPVAHDAHPTHTLAPIDLLYEGLGVRRRRSVPSHIQGHNEPTRGLLPAISPIRPEESVPPFVLPNEGMLAFALIRRHT